MSNAIIMDAYSPIGDLICISLCWTMLILVFCSYMRRTRSFNLFFGILFSLLLAANSSIVYRTMHQSWQPSFTVPIYATRLIMHATMFAVLALYVAYFAEVTRLGKSEKRRTYALVGCLWALLFLYDLYGTVTGRTFRIDSNGQTYTGLSIFSIGYLIFVAFNLFMLIRVRKRIYKRIIIGFFLTEVLAILVNLIQRLNGQSSFTVVSFCFPVLAMLYFFHSNPYDTRIGAVNRTSMDDYIRRCHAMHRSFGFISLYLPDFNQAGKQLPEELQAIIRNDALPIFRGAVLFFIEKGHYVFMYPKNRNLDEKVRLVHAMKVFQTGYQQFHYDHKIVIGQSVATTAIADYVSFIHYLHRSMGMNTIHYVASEDWDNYNRYAYILSELTDIYNRHDLNDPRVLVYAQPVYNVALKRYDTAEALMRLKLEKTGLVFPDQFIPVAEENGFIHVLTEIILHKTCREIRLLAMEGYLFSRISVNVAAEEMQLDSFCDDILRIIHYCGIHRHQVAIELTESENESDFPVTKEKILALREEGIKFYLDDFGTGYSSLERILQLPFDIIKFDRTMVMASRTGAQAIIVKRMAQLFADLNYSVLFEGIEDEEDEQRCCSMSASYLQGYRYSKPVPIDEMTRFFERKPVGSTCL
ncbi:MAG: EAL domain-containing protein [Clostridia bacterium]|nr:EAL domain-containing protein [Clostridia bacterium]